jgi:hypothetical protein
MTIENATIRLWLCCRSMVIVSEAFNLINVCVFKIWRQIPMSGFLICWTGTQLGA